MTPYNPVEKWESYRDKVYKDVLPLSKNQERECSRAFFAGMYFAFTELVELSGSVSDEELAAERMDDFQQAIVNAAKETL